MEYPNYNNLCVAVLLRLGEDKNIQNGKIVGYTTSVQAYIKAIPQLMYEGIAALGVPFLIVPPLTDTTILELEPEAYALCVLYCEAILRKINDEDYAMSTLSEFYQRRDEYIKRKGSLAPKAVIKGGIKL